MTRERATEWIENVHDEVRNAHIQDDLFWQFQEVIHENEKLANSQNVFLYWINTLFKDAIIMAVRRQIDRDPQCISLRNLLSEFHDDAALTGGRFAADEIQADIAEIDRRGLSIRGFADRRVAHADPRQLGAGHPTFRDIQDCLAALCDLVNKYAAALCDSPPSILPPAGGTAWREIFTFPWLDS